VNEVHRLSCRLARTWLSMRGEAALKI
jgi:hypothetical protein